MQNKRKKNDLGMMRLHDHFQLNLINEYAINDLSFYQSQMINLTASFHSN